jgi:hypothetical protein
MQVKRRDKRIYKGLVNGLSLVVTGSLLLGLLLEPLALVERIVQLCAKKRAIRLSVKKRAMVEQSRTCVRVANLLGGHEDLETLAESRDGSVSLGEWRHDLGMAHCANPSRQRDRENEQDATRHSPMNDGEMHCTSIKSPTSLSRRRALVLGSGQSTSCCKTHQTSASLICL